MMTVKEVREWLDTMNYDDEIGISDSGMHLATEDGLNWLEIGALPEGSEGARI
jgi:hypothetical protein